MRKRPLSLFICALLFLYFPANEIWIWYSNQETPAITELALSLVLPVLLLFGLIRVTRTGWYTLIAMVSLWGVRDLYEFYVSQGASVVSLFVHLFIYSVSLVYFINPRIRHLYFDPKLRWWRTKPRFETHMPFVMRSDSAWHYPILRNISEGGCFIETPHPLSMGDTIQVMIPLPVPLEVSVIKAIGEVRWVSRSADRMGMGIQFRNPPADHSRAIRQFVGRGL
jgi:Tfp pilus assembly protein PilZ